MSDKITWTNERRKLSELIPWPRNPRQIKTDQAKRLVQSFDEFGQVETIAIGPGNEVYNGHQRLNVLASQNGKDYEVEVRVASRALEEKEREKLTIFLHKGAAGEWDFDTLANEFELDDLLEWGFDKKELDIDLWAGEQPDDPGAQIDKAEELREKWGVESGQLWKLGDHRLICGDCTDRAVVEMVMGGEKAGLIVTDPPYGVDYEYDTHNDSDGIEYWKLMDNWQSVSPECARLVTMPYKHVFEWSRRYDPSGYLAWYDKTKQSPHSLAYLSKIELIFVFGKLPNRYAWDIFEVDGVRGDGLRELHTCPKPVLLFEKLIEPQAERNSIVYDPFLGSGTTLIACERLSRKCRAVEISPAYCAVAIQRWADMTGGEPSVIQDKTDV